MNDSSHAPSSVLDQLDLTLSLDKPTYRDRLIESQVRLHRLAYELYRRRRSLTIVYEGWDAAGKGGNIRRVIQKLDPRGYRVYSIAAPTGEDARHHYLWRFWRRLLAPEDKQIVIFDRSWYGRVLVERVEGYATEAEWKRAYREINEFERQLIDHDGILVKFFIHLSKEEQERRFKAREATPHKRWKLTEEDWRNRGHWEDYDLAIRDMLRKTSTLRAPWTLIEGDNKCWARIRALETLVTTLEGALGETKESKSHSNKSHSKRKKDKKKGN